MTYFEVFKKRHTFLTVVHAVNLVQVIRNVRLSIENGADGVFLINHDISVDSIRLCYEEARIRYLYCWIGLNVLGLPPTEALAQMPRTLQGLWVDDPGIRVNDATIAREFNLYRHHKTGWEGIYFGGVAFKYQEEVFDDKQAAQAAVRALPFTDVITTSGEKTGTPPSVKKIKVMKEAIEDVPLAIASGITPENVRSYLPYADCFLVATGISHSKTELDPARVRELSKQIESY